MFQRHTLFQISQFELESEIDRNRFDNLNSSCSMHLSSQSSCSGHQFVPRACSIQGRASTHQLFSPNAYDNSAGSYFSSWTVHPIFHAP